MLQQLKSAYDLHLWMKALAWLGLLGGAVLLYRLAGGFPPRAWFLLARAVPTLPRLLPARGWPVLVPFAGLLVLCLSWVALWLLLACYCAALLWHAASPRFHAPQPVTATNWQRFSEEYLRNAGRADPQASMAFASARNALPSTPPVLPPVQGKSKQAQRASVEANGAVWGEERSRPDESRETRVTRPVRQSDDVGVGFDPGITRKHKPNEDSVLVLRSTCTFQGRLIPLALYVVADGMGGHAAGQIASHIATHSMMQNVLPTVQHGEELTEEFLIESLVDCTHWANQAIYQFSQEHDVDLGTTITAALLVDSTAYIVNVGDSRTYLYRAGEGLVQVTRDHSLVARLVAVGAISAEEVYTHPDRNKVYRGLGEKDAVQVDWFVEPLGEGDYLLLCSDGLWEMVRDHEMEHILQRYLPDVTQASGALVKAALQHGGADNISAIVARV